MSRSVSAAVCVFFFNATATTEIYTLSLHDALPISAQPQGQGGAHRRARPRRQSPRAGPGHRVRHPRNRSLTRSEEHTSELQSRVDLVCRLLLEKKKKKSLKQRKYSQRLHHRNLRDK